MSLFLLELLLDVSLQTVIIHAADVDTRCTVPGNVPRLEASVADGGSDSLPARIYFHRGTRGLLDNWRESGRGRDRGRESRGESGGSGG